MSEKYVETLKREIKTIRKREKQIEAKIRESHKVGKPKLKNEEELKTELADLRAQREQKCKELNALNQLGKFLSLEKE